MLTFIVDPNAGGEKGYRIWRRLERRLIRQGEEYQVFLTGAEGEARDIASQLTRDTSGDCGTLVAVGGDGLMNEILDGVHISDSLRLGFIPIDKRSDLARGLKLPKKPAACLDHILSGSRYTEQPYGVVDYGDSEPGHRRFLVNCGCGFDAVVTEVLKSYTREHFTGIPVISKLTKFLIFCRCLFASRTVPGYVILDGARRVELNNIFLVSAQIQPTGCGGLKLASGVRRENGQFVVCILHNRSKLQLLRVVLAAFVANPSGFAGVRDYGCKEMKVVLESPLPMHTDGESCGSHTEFTMRCIQRKLTFLC